MPGLAKHCLRFVLRCQRLWIADRFKYFSQNLLRHLRFGFYSLDNYYPGSLGQGIIANELLTLLNSTYHTSFPLLDLNVVGNDDPAGRFTPAAVMKPITTGESK